MLQQQVLRIQPTDEGAVFINPEGDRIVRTNGEVAAEIEAIVEAIPAGQEVVLFFAVEIPEEFAYLTGDSPITSPLFRLHDRNGYKPLAAVEAALEADEDVERCAYCNGEIDLDGQFREVEGVPGRDYAHVECGYSRAG